MYMDKAIILNNSRTLIISKLQALYMDKHYYYQDN